MIFPPILYLKFGKKRKHKENKMFHSKIAEYKKFNNTNYYQIDFDKEKGFFYLEKIESKISKKTLFFKEKIPINNNSKFLNVLGNIYYFCKKNIYNHHFIDQSDMSNILYIHNNLDILVSKDYDRINRKLYFLKEKHKTDTFVLPLISNKRLNSNIEFCIKKSFEREILFSKNYYILNDSSLHKSILINIFNDLCLEFFPYSEEVFMYINSLVQKQYIDICKRYKVKSTLLLPRFNRCYI